MATLYPSQEEAVSRMKNGCILCGQTGSGKSLTALTYYMRSISEFSSSALYIITTARKRDTKEWDIECEKSGICNESLIFIDSWNNLHKYTEVKDAFFIFDEQRVVGKGKWVKAFLTITKENRWILLTATPGDNWNDYIPIFIANGFYKNRTSFLRQHAIYSQYSKYPKIDRWTNVGKLERLRELITVNMDVPRQTIPHYENIEVEYDKELYRIVVRRHWNPWDNEPIREIGKYGYLMRKAVYSHESRLNALFELSKKYKRIVVFYNYDYELEAMRGLKKENYGYLGDIAEWNGHYHESIPNTDRWLYLVQYAAGGEGWNCTQTNVMVFYSQSYSYKAMVQSAGRIDRLNTPYRDLYYYTMYAGSPIEKAINMALENKKDFNERKFLQISN